MNLYFFVVWYWFFMATFCSFDLPFPQRLRTFGAFVQGILSSALFCLYKRLRQTRLFACQYLDALGQNVTKVMQTIFSAKRKIRLYEETCNFLFDLKRLKLRLGGFFFQG